MNHFQLLGLVLPLLFTGCGPGTGSVEVRSSYATDDGYDENYDESYDESYEYEDDVIFVDEDEEDVNEVVYREYFDCSDEEIAMIPYFRRYYQLDDDDLFFLFTVCRHTRRPIDVVIRSYHYDCNRDYDRVIRTYRVPRRVFFVEAPRSIRFEGHLARPYRAWHRREYERESFSRDEYRAMVGLKIGVEFGRRRPEHVAREVHQYQEAPRRAIYKDRDRLGHGGRNVRGQEVRREAPRVWSMPQERRHEVRVERKRQAQEHRPRFEREHTQRVKEVREQDPRMQERRNERENQRENQRKIRPDDDRKRPDQDPRKRHPEKP